MNKAIMLGVVAIIALAVPPAHAQGGGITQTLDGAAVKSISHIGITVSDIDATIAFYSKAVPFPVIKRFKVKGSAFASILLAKPHREVEIALIAMPTGIIQLMDFEPSKPTAPNPRPVIGPGYTHICFQSSASDPAVKRFMAAGLANISRFGKPDGVDIGGYGVRYAYGRDPDGIMIENESVDAPKRSEAAWITHIANTVHDRDAMLAFYGRVLGRKAYRTIEQEGRPRLDDVADIDGLKIKGGWINVGNMEIEIWEYERPRTPKPLADRKLDEIGYNSFALEVVNVKAARARLSSLEVRLVGSVFRLGNWKLQYAYDPEGNLFAMQEEVAR